jgi:hypothetical protein
VDNYGILLVIDVEVMRIVSQAWIKETNSLLPESLREAIIADGAEKFIDVLKNRMSPGELEQYRKQSARHFLPKEAIRMGLFSPDGRWLFCGTNLGLRGLEWNDVLRCPDMGPVPVRLSADAESALVDLGDRASVEQKSVCGIAYDALRQRVLFSGVEGKVSFLGLNDARAGNLLVVPGRVPLFHLALTSDRSALVATARRFDFGSNKEMPSHFQVWNYPALCRAVGLEH